jgi:hypothetical protein
MTLEDNVALPLVYAGVDARNAAGAGARCSPRSASALRRIAAQPHFRRPAAARGDRPRAGQRAALILADEPTGNLDSHTSEEIMALFRRAQRRRHHHRAGHPRADIAAHAKRQVRFLDGLIVSDERRRRGGQRMLKPMLGEAWHAMGANRLRTALTMLGMVIGVGSVVLMMAIGQGAQYAVAQTISTMGSNLYIVISGSFHRGGVRSGGGGGPTLTSPTPRRSPNSTASSTSRRCTGHAATGLWREQLERDGRRHDAGLPRRARLDLVSGQPSAIPTCARRRAWR